MMFVGDSGDRAQRAVAIGRELDDPAVLARALTACGYIEGARYNAEAATAYYSEALDLARTLNDQWSLSQILAWQSNTAIAAGDPIAARAAGEEGRSIGDAIGDGSNSRHCRLGVAWASLMEGNVAGAVAQFRAVNGGVPRRLTTKSIKPIGLMGLGMSLSHHGEVNAARAAADVAVEGAVGS